MKVSKVFGMTVYFTSSTSSISNIQLITDALLDYTKITGIDLSKNPFATAIERASSPEAILELLQERERRHSRAIGKEIGE